MHASALAALRATGVTHVVVLAPEEPDAPEERRRCDGEVYAIDRALEEGPLPHSEACGCVYAPYTPQPPLTTR